MSDVRYADLASLVLPIGMTKLSAFSTCINRCVSQLSYCFMQQIEL